MRFPFLFLALSLVLGILLSSLLSLPLFSWILSLAASLTCGWLCYSIHKNKLAFVFILLSTFLLGASFYTSTNINFENNSLRKLEFTSYADFTGKLDSSDINATMIDESIPPLKKTPSGTSDISRLRTPAFNNSRAWTTASVSSICHFGSKSSCHQRDILGF